MCAQHWKEDLKGTFEDFGWQMPKSEALPLSSFWVCINGRIDSRIIEVRSFWFSPVLLSYYNCGLEQMFLFFAN